MLWSAPGETPADPVIVWSVADEVDLCCRGKVAEFFNSPNPLRVVFIAIVPKEVKPLGKETLEILMDFGITCENISRSGRNLGCVINLEEQKGGSAIIVLKK